MFDWQGLRQRRPRLFLLIVAAKRYRTRIGLLFVLAYVAQVIFLRQKPHELISLDGAVVLGVFLILIGLGLRIAAMGNLQKKERLCTTGVHSLCRHPLYAGSMLIAYGFCCLLGDLESFIMTSAYFLLFYPLTIVWEEIRLADRYGDEHRRYARRTPLLLPYGSFRRGAFDWKVAHSHGAGLLVGVTVCLVAAVEVMARTLGH